MTLPTACFREAVLYLRARYGTGPGMNLLFPADFRNVTYISPSRTAPLHARPTFLPGCFPPTPGPPRDVAFAPAAEPHQRPATGKERIQRPPSGAQTEVAAQPDTHIAPQPPSAIRAAPV